MSQQDLEFVKQAALAAMHSLILAHGRDQPGSRWLANKAYEDAEAMLEEQKRGG